MISGVLFQTIGPKKEFCIIKVSEKYILCLSFFFRQLCFQGLLSS